MPASRDEIVENLRVVRARLEEAAAGAGRDPGDVRLVAATKTVPADVIAAAVRAGVTDCGENYVRELRDKRAALAGEPVRWHYIGALQSGSAHQVADLADVVETVAGEHAARRLAGRAARSGRELDVLIEVDFTTERAGVDPGDLGTAADLVAGLPGLRLRGLMTIAPVTETSEGARPWYRRLRELRETLRRTHPGAVELSMGMSGDYFVAVQEGATMVRIGTALFGARPR